MSRTCQGPRVCSSIGVWGSWFVQGRLLVMVCTGFESLEVLARTKEERCLISSHLEERVGKEPRREEEMTKKESTSGTIQVLKLWFLCLMKIVFL